MSASARRGCTCARPTRRTTRARELAAAGAPHGTLVTAGEQTAGRGRQGRTLERAARAARCCMSLVAARPAALLPLAAAVAVADVAGDGARIKWPNDVLLDGRKVAGILVEGRPQEGWAVLGIGLNVAVRLEDLPRGAARPRGRRSAATPRRRRADARRLLARSSARLARAGDGDARRPGARATRCSAARSRWAGGEGAAAGHRRRRARCSSRGRGRGGTALDAGEVHLER